MSIFLRFLLILLLAQAVPAADVDIAFFESKIRPVLVQHCYDCHSSDASQRNKLKAGLLLDTRQGMLAGGESGPSLTAGVPETSLIIQSLQHDGGVPEMPPSGKLPQQVIDDFTAWVRGGAPDPRTENTPQVKRGMSQEEGRQFWSFRPPTLPELPQIADLARSADPLWSRTAIDRMLQHRMHGERLTAVEEVDRATWLRRVHFDLVGLPPSLEQIDAFENDRAPDARVRVVDALLASPQFGERWGRHWLDSVRYADSNGRDRNVFWYYAWRYRNYVFSAFNADLPYDRFVTEQVAGDLLPAESKAERDRLRIATAFLALGPKAFEEQKPDVFRMDVVDEQIEVLGRSILGLSVSCARCHDHKFDPIPTKDYYALAGILRNTQPLYGYGPKGIKATNHHHTELYAVGADAEHLSEQGLAYIERLNQLTLTQNTARSDRYRVVRRLADARLQLAKPDSDQKKLQADILTMEAEIKEWDCIVRAAEDDLQCAMEAPPPMPDWTMGARERSQIEDCRVHVRGDVNNLGDQVARGVLQILPQTCEPMPSDQSGRIQLAKWLTALENPLTARVFVNRVWQHLFGRGLVATPDDFGVNGAKPSHANVLDFLAVRFMQEGWSTKRSIRQIVLTRAYASASVAHEENEQIDPDNVYLWRMTPRRLEAEAFRDAILAISGQLDYSRPSQLTSVYAKLQPWRDVEYRNFSPEFKPEGIEHPFRSMYLPVVRGVLPPIFQLFDFAAPDRPIAQRDESTVPSQSLFMMNNAWVIAQAQHLATAILEVDSPDDESRVRYLYRRAFARFPTGEELAEAMHYLRPAADSPGLAADLRSTASQFENWTNLCQAIIASAEFRYLK